MPQNVNGNTRLYAILGDPIAQVGSPENFNRLFAESEHNGIMTPVLAKAEHLENIFAGLRAIGNLGGLIFTIPHKIAMAGLVDELAPNGRRVGAINAARPMGDGRWQGDMFDGLGCVAALEKSGEQLTGRNVLQVGAGGVGRAIAFAFAEAGIAQLTISDLDQTRAEQLAKDVRAAFPNLEAGAGAPRVEGQDTVVNCTPLGMRDGDPLPIPATDLAGAELAIDVILSDDATPFLAVARDHGCKVQTGHQMLRGQVTKIAAYFGVK